MLEVTWRCAVVCQDDVIAPITWQLLSHPDSLGHRVPAVDTGAGGRVQVGCSWGNVDGGVGLELGEIDGAELDMRNCRHCRGHLFKLGEDWICWKERKTNRDLV